MTAPNVTETEPERLARLRRDLRTLKDRGAPEDVVQYYISKHLTTPELEAAKEGQPGIVATLFDDPASGLRALGATVAQAVSAVPGGKAALSVMGMRGGRSYRDSEAAIDEATGKLPTVSRVGASLVGGAVAGRALTNAVKGLAPGAVKTALATPARQAGAYGAAMGAADADPDVSLSERAAQTAIGGIGGMAIGKGVEVLANAAGRGATGIRALFAKSPAEQILKQKGARDAAAATNFDDVLASAEGREATSAIRDVMDDPFMQPIVEGIRQSPRYRNVDPSSPKLMDAVYKELSARERDIRRGLSGPTRANSASRSSELADIGEMKRRLLSAMEATGERVTPAVVVEAPAITTAQSPRPSTREAIDAFRERSAEAARRSKPETVAQRSAREMLERHSAEDIVSPPLSGKPPGPRMVEVEPETREAVPAMMSGYRGAVKDYAARTRNMDAIRAGNDAVTAAMRPRTSGVNLDRTSAARFEQLARELPDAEREFFESSVLGSAGDQIKGGILPRSLWDALGLNPIRRVALPAKAADQMVRAARGKGPRNPTTLTTSVLASLLAELDGAR